MCGIWAYINLNRNKPISSYDVIRLFQDFYSLKHRGPDNSYFETYNNVILGFHRLAIVDDTFKSNQPFIIEDDLRTIILMCNGEIYNYKDIISENNMTTIKNDCAVIIEKYYNMTKNGESDKFNEFVESYLKGNEFAFTLFEFNSLKNLHKVVVARDEIGVRPLYYSPTSDNGLLFTSEIKGGHSYSDTITEFPPGNIFTYYFNEVNEVYIDKYTFASVYEQDTVNTLKDEEHLNMVRESVLSSVRARLSNDKPFAFLLSGGVDSSLVASLSARILGKPIRTFCCGLKDENGNGIGTDLKYARMVAEHIKSNHTEVLFTPEEALLAIPDVIRTIESWDTTTVRASVGQYLVCKYIGQNTDCKVVCVGEGPDEVCSSYLFNWYAPDGNSLHDCAKKYVSDIHYYDVKRADRCIARWGLEGRVPLLDTRFIETYWKIPSEKRMPTYKNMEKWFLRKAFDGTNVLPNEVLWRTKEAFSDAVSSKEKSWFNIIQEWVEYNVSDEEMARAKEVYGYCTPKTKEALYYRKVFCQIFGENRQEILPRYWQPRWSSDGKEVCDYIDPSARVLQVYNSLSETSS